MNYSWYVSGVLGISAPYDPHSNTVTNYVVYSDQHWHSPMLTDKLGRTLPGTLFVERCVEAPALNAPVACTVTINTGRQVYVGYNANTQDPPDGTFTSLASIGSPDTIVITKTDPEELPPNNHQVSIRNNG
ncbi:MAG TPA: hypothetical protein VHX15_06710 [Frankiaceae bacterium]|jgi:hypothetical protein|nr:hypothetical protein [Frankiaceae bacterium]